MTTVIEFPGDTSNAKTMPTMDTTVVDSEFDQLLDILESGGLLMNAIDCKQAGLTLAFEINHSPVTIEAFEAMQAIDRRFKADAETRVKIIDYCFQVGAVYPHMDACQKT